MQLDEIATDIRLAIFDPASIRSDERKLGAALLIP
jgi:hypothetical protein